MAIHTYRPTDNSTGAQIIPGFQQEDAIFNENEFIALSGIEYLVRRVVKSAQSGLITFIYWVEPAAPIEDFHSKLSKVITELEKLL